MFALLERYSPSTAAGTGRSIEFVHEYSPTWISPFTGELATVGLEVDVLFSGDALFPAVTDLVVVLAVVVERVMLVDS